MKSPDPLSIELRGKVENARRVADQSFTEAAAQLHVIPEMKPAEAQISEAEAAFQAFLGFRSRLDQNLPKHGAEREPAVVEGFSPSITKLIDVSGNSLRLTLETVTRAPTAALGQLVSLRNLTAQMAENAGRERALLGGIIGSQTRMNTAGVQNIAGYRGKVDLAWDTISPIRKRADLPKKVAEAIAGVEKDYFQVYGETRDAVLAAGETAEYKISGNEYVARATTAINSILRLADAVGEAADQRGHQRSFGQQLSPDRREFDIACLSRSGAVQFLGRDLADRAAVVSADRSDGRTCQGQFRSGAAWTWTARTKSVTWRARSEPSRSRTRRKPAKKPKPK